MTVTRPGLTVRDSQILELLQKGVSRDRAYQIGAYRRSWTAADVDRVQAAWLPGKRSASRPPVTPPTIRTPMPERVADQPARIVRLSPRVADTVEQLCRGLSNRMIAETLGVTEDTIKTQLKVILRELDARDRLHAVVLVLTGEVEIRRERANKRPE